MKEILKCNLWTSKKSNRIERASFGPKMIRPILYIPAAVALSPISLPDRWDVSMRAPLIFNSQVYFKINEIGNMRKFEKILSKVQSEFVTFFLNELKLNLKIEIIWMKNFWEGRSLQSGRMQVEIWFGFPFEFILQVRELEENGK